MSLEKLRHYVGLESPTGDAGALAALAEVLEADAATAGFATTRERDHLLWTLPARGVTGGELLLLSHYDTVWPVGTLASMPWSVEGDTVRGPGAYDTKAGLVALLAAVTRLRASDQDHP